MWPSRTMMYAMVTGITNVRSPRRKINTISLTLREVVVHLFDLLRPHGFRVIFQRYRVGHDVRFVHVLPVRRLAGTIQHILILEHLTARYVFNQLSVQQRLADGEALVAEIVEIMCEKNQKILQRLELKCQVWLAFILLAGRDENCFFCRGKTTVVWWSRWSLSANSPWVSWQR